MTRVIFLLLVTLLKTKLIPALAIITLFIATIPFTNAAATEVKISNLSGNSYTFTTQQLTEMPKTIEYADLTCYGTLLAAGDWGGVQLTYLLQTTGVSWDVRSIQFKAADNYAVSIPIELAQTTQTIIAYEKDGQPLSEGLRLVLPGYNGAAWISQIVSITMSNDEAPTPTVSGKVKDVLQNLNDYRSILDLPASTPTPTQATMPKPTPPATTNPTSTPTQTPLVTGTQFPPLGDQAKTIQTDYLLPVSVVFGAILMLFSFLVLKHRGTKKVVDPKASIPNGL